MTGTPATVHRSPSNARERQRIEKKIRKAAASQVILIERNAAREHDPLGLNVSRLCFAPQMIDAVSSIGASQSTLPSSVAQ